MRIIKSGKLKNKIIKCSNCECEFEYEVTDIQKIYQSYVTLTYSHQNKMVHCVYCPECGKKYDLFSTLETQNFDNITLTGACLCQEK